MISAPARLMAARISIMPLFSSYGLYLYVVKTFDGKFKKVGKFAIIR